MPRRRSLLKKSLAAALADQGLDVQYSDTSKIGAGPFNRRVVIVNQDDGHEECVLDDDDDDDDCDDEEMETNDADDAEKSSSVNTKFLSRMLRSLAKSNERAGPKNQQQQQPLSVRRQEAEDKIRRIAAQAGLRVEIFPLEDDVPSAAAVAARAATIECGSGAASSSAVAPAPAPAPAPSRLFSRALSRAVSSPTAAAVMSISPAIPAPAVAADTAADDDTAAPSRKRPRTSLLGQALASVRRDSL